MVTYEELMNRVRTATNLVDLSLITDDFVFEVAEHSSEGQIKAFNKAVEKKQAELLGEAPVSEGEFDVSVVNLPSQPQPKPKQTRFGRVEYGENYVVTDGKESPPFALPELDFELTGRWDYVPKHMLDAENPTLLNIPPKDITYYLPHMRGGKLYITPVTSNTQIRAAETMLFKYMQDGGSPNLAQVFKSYNTPLIVEVDGQEITKIETILYYQQEGFIFRKIYSFWGMHDGLLSPVPIRVIK